DPHQLKNLLPSKEPELLAAVKDGDARIEALAASGAALNPVAVDAETRKRVEALGYVVPDGKAIQTGADPKDVHRYAQGAFDALALLFAKRYEDCEKLSLRGLEVMPGSSQLHDILARLYLETKRPALALPHAKEAARMNPQFADFAAQVAYTYLLLGDLPS